LNFIFLNLLFSSLSEIWYMLGNTSLITSCLPDALLENFTIFEILLRKGKI
jgi:hypothetical protein